MKPDLVPVILCGGSGSRLWPLSRESYPKQFVDPGNGETLFKKTLKRLDYLEDRGDPICVCGEKDRFYVAPLIPSGDIILEPVARNTAPAIALAAFRAMAGGGDPLLLILPADHYISDPAGFASAIKAAIPLAESGKIVTFGIEPTSPATGFGYIKAGEPLGAAGREVARFVEKPDEKSAKEMLASGDYFWNAGIFLVRASVYLRELEKCAPDIYNSCLLAFEKGDTESGFFRPDAEAYAACRDQSIDYAIMEHTRDAAISPMAIGWNDLGSWDAFYANADKDANGTAISGRVMVDDARDCYIHSSGRLVAAIGVEGLAIIETQDAVLVAPRKETGKIKDLVARLKAEGASEYKLHRLVYKPWGTFEELASGERFQVNRITVNPGAAISLQKHHHRAEHWIVVSGTAEITNGDQVSIYTENQSTYIPVGKIHRLRNPGLIPLCIIEIQSGPYLGADDIIRLDDPYARRDN